MSNKLREILRFKVLIVLPCLFMAAISLSSTTGDEVAPDQSGLRAKLQDIRESLRKAGQLYRKDEFQSSAKQLQSVKEKLDELDALPLSAAARKASGPLRKSWQKATRLVQEQQSAVAALDSTEPAKVSFVADIAPEIQSRCIRCHGEGRARQELRLDSFTDFLKGGENGETVDLDDPKNSLILLKMRGEADGDRMPPNGRPMSEDWLAKFEQWLREGARFDGQDTSATLQQEMRAAQRSRWSAEELRAANEQQAIQNWKLAFPGREHRVTRTNNLLIVAAPNADDADVLSRQLEEAFVDVVSYLGLPKDTELKGRLAIFRIPRSYDYTEWGTMVEKRSAPRRAQMHWGADGGAAYVVLGPKSWTEKKKLADELGLKQQMTAAVLAQWGAPNWYAEGRSWVARGQASRRDPTLRAMQQTVRGVLPKIKRSEDVFDAKLPSGQAEAAAWAFAGLLNQDRRQSTRLHGAIREGKSFETAFAAAYGTSPKTIGDRWVESLKPKKSRQR